MTVPQQGHETARTNFAAKIVNGDNARAMNALLFAVILAATATKPAPPPDLSTPPADAMNVGNGLITKVLVAGNSNEMPSDDDFVKIRYTLWSSPDGKEILSREELIERFTLEGIGRANAVFNFHESDPRRWTDDKAVWMNAEYIRTMPLAELIPMIKAELRSERLWREEYDEDERGWFEKAVDLIRQRFFTLKDFSSQGRAYFSEDFDFEEAAVRKNILKEPKLKELLLGLADRLEAVDPFTASNVEAALRAIADEAGVKAGLFINASRTMLTGQAVGPSMFEVFEIMGRERSVNRLRSGVPWFDAMEELGDV